MIIFSELPCKRVFIYIWACWNIALLLCLIHLFLYKHLIALHFCLARGRNLSVLGNSHTLYSIYKLGELPIWEFIFNSDYFFCIPGYLKERAHSIALMMTNVYYGSNSREYKEQLKEFN